MSKHEDRNLESSKGEGGFGVFIRRRFSDFSLSLSFPFTLALESDTKPPMKIFFQGRERGGLLAVFYFIF